MQRHTVSAAAVGMMWPPEKEVPFGAIGERKRCHLVPFLSRWISCSTCAKSCFLSRNYDDFHVSLKRPLAPPPNFTRPAVNSTTAGRFLFAANTLKTRHLRLCLCQSLPVSRDGLFAVEDGFVSPFPIAQSLFVEVSDLYRKARTRHLYHRGSLSSAPSGKRQSPPKP